MTEEHKKDLDILKDVFLSKEVGDEDYEDNLRMIQEWENELLESEVLAEWQAHDITIRIMDQVHKSYVDMGLELALNRELTDDQRNAIYAKQDAIWFLFNLGGINAEEKITQIQQDIKKALNATK